MPKTRSGKIMRRVIAAVSNFADTGDVTKLAPEVVDSIRHHLQAAKAARGDVPRELTEAESEEESSSRGRGRPAGAGAAPAASVTLAGPGAQRRSPASGCTGSW